MPYVSPGVYVREFDFSQYVAALSTTVCGMVGTAQKGPLNVATLISNEAQFIDTFGEPFTSSMAGYAALQYLRRGTRLLFVRVGSASVDKASVTIKDEAAGTNDALKVEALTEGEWGNDVDIVIAAGTVAGTFKLNVVINNFAEESFDNLVIDSPSDAQFCETVINGTSRHITVEDLTGTFGVPKYGTYDLAGGDNGITGIADADYIGTASPATGLQTLVDPETVDLNMVAIPGISSAAVVNAIITFCETRNDCLGLIDPPMGLDVQGVIDWHNGEGYVHAAFVSNKCALFWPWLQIYDQYSRQNVWVPPSGQVAQAIAYNDSVAEPWFAPAGIVRGHLFEPLSIEYSPTQGERDTLYSGGNAVNPIVNFTRDGINIYGQRTLQRTASSLDRINVRRMLFFAEKSIATSARFLVFDQNDATLWRRFIDLVEPFLESIQARRGLEEFQVICDESTNPDWRRNNNEMNGKIYLIPTKSAEKIIIDFALFPSGANFVEPTSF